MKKSESVWWLQGCPFSSTFGSKHAQPYFVFIGVDVLFVQVTFQLISVPTVVCFAANCCIATWSTMAPLVECRLVFFDVLRAAKDNLPCEMVRQAATGTASAATGAATAATGAATAATGAAAAATGTAAEPAARAPGTVAEDSCSNFCGRCACNSC